MAGKSKEAERTERGDEQLVATQLVGREHLEALVFPPVHSGPQSIRYRPMLVNAGITALALLLLWNWPDILGMWRVIFTPIILFASSVWFFIWLFFRSRMSTQAQWSVVGTICAVVLLGAANFRVAGYNGDMLPLLEPRWLPGAVATTQIELEPEPLPEVSFDPAPTDWPGFLGRQRNAHVGGIRLAQDWDASPPKLLWRRAIGVDAGFSSFAVVGDVAVTQQQADDDELVACYEVASGKVVWVHSDAQRFDSSLGGIGPRATPTIHDGRVYTLGATGILNCLELASGKKLWSRNILKDNDATVPDWGIACSPLVVDDLVVVTGGFPVEGARSFSTLRAYDRHDGQPAWSAGRDKASYSSPTLATLQGQRQILMVNHCSVTAHDVTTGEVLWEMPWAEESPNVSQPIAISDELVFVSKGYGEGAALWQVSRQNGEWQVTRQWCKYNVMKTKFTNAVIHGDHAYGLSDGLLECIDVAKGKTRWKVRKPYGHGQVLLVGDVLLVQAESGEVALVEVNPNRHNELARFSPLTSRTWNYPTLAGRYLLVRNDREIACFEMPMASNPSALAAER